MIVLFQLSRLRVTCDMGFRLYMRDGQGSLEMEGRNAWPNDTDKQTRRIQYSFRFVEPNRPDVVLIEKQSSQKHSSIDLYFTSAPTLTHIPTHPHTHTHTHTHKHTRASHLIVLDCFDENRESSKDRKPKKKTSHSGFKDILHPE